MNCKNTTRSSSPLKRQPISPAIQKIVTILLTMPVGNVSCERSFSATGYQYCTLQCRHSLCFVTRFSLTNICRNEKPHLFADHGPVGDHFLALKRPCVQKVRYSRVTCSSKRRHYPFCAEEDRCFHQPLNGIWEITYMSGSTVCFQHHSWSC